MVRNCTAHELCESNHTGKAFTKTRIAFKIDTLHNETVLLILYNDHRTNLTNYLILISHYLN